MQPFPRPGAADVEQAAQFSRAGVNRQRTQIGVDRAVAGARRPRLERRQQQAPVAFAPLQQLLLDATGAPREAGQDDDVEFEALGAVQRHDLDARVLSCIGFDVMRSQRFGECAPVGNIAALGVGGEQREILVGSGQIDRARHACWTPERRPCVANQARKRHATAPLHRGQDRRHEAAQSQSAVDADAFDRVDRFAAGDPLGQRVAARGQGEQIG